MGSEMCIRDRLEDEQQGDDHKFIKFLNDNLTKNGKFLCLILILADPEAELHAELPDQLH